MPSQLDYRNHLIGAEQTHDEDIHNMRRHLGILKQHVEQMTDDERNRYEAQKLRLRCKMKTLFHYNEE